MNQNLLYLCCLALAVAVLSVNARPAQSVNDEPSFCHDLDCPKYTIADKNDDYEVRKYESSKWAGTVIKSTDWQKAVNEAFDMLFKYISGANRNDTKIPMAAPVATKIVPLGNGESNFTVLFFTPFAYKIGTPVPTDPKLAIVELPAITAYVKEFGGFERDKQLTEYTKDLVTELERDGMKFIKPDEFFFTAGYDPPYRFDGRHNEVWLIAA